MELKKSISVKTLAKIINVHYSTLSSWLCHFSLTAYIFTKPAKFGKTEKWFKLNNSSIEALKSYIGKKSPVYLKSLNKGIKHIYEDN